MHLRSLNLLLLASFGAASCGTADQASKTPAQREADSTADSNPDDVSAANRNSAGDAAVGPSASTEAAGTPATAPAILQTQPGPKGSSVDLNRISVVGNVMTVQLTYRAPSSIVHFTKLSEVNVVFDNSSQRASVLKDDAGRWLAAPLSGMGDSLAIRPTGSSPLVVWLKFPAPPPSVSTVSLNIPEVGSFDGMPIAR